MGYTHLTDISQLIPPSAVQKTAGTWTPTIAANLVSDVRTAAAASFTLLIPVVLPGSTGGLQGARLESLDVFYKIATKAGSAFTFALNQVALADNGVACLGASVDITPDSSHNTAAKCYAIGDHKLTVSVDQPAFIKSGTALWLSLAITAQDTTVFSFFGAQANFTLRL